MFIEYKNSTFISQKYLHTLIFKYDLQSYKWSYLVNEASFLKLFELVNFNSKTFNVVIDLSNMVKLRVNM